MFTCRFYKVFGRYPLCPDWTGLDSDFGSSDGLDWTGSFQFNPFHTLIVSLENRFSPITTIIEDGGGYDFDAIIFSHPTGWNRVPTFLP